MFSSSQILFLKVLTVRFATLNLFSASELKSMYSPLDPIKLTPNWPVPVWAIWHYSKSNLGIILRCGWHTTCNTQCCLEEAENTWSVSWELYWWDMWYQGCSTHLWFGWYFLQLRRTDSTALVQLLKKILSRKEDPWIPNSLSYRWTLRTLGRL